MTIDLAGLMTDMFSSTWFLVLVVVATLSCIWYYITHSYHTVRNRELRAPGSIMRRFLWGQALTLLVILIAVVIFAGIAVTLLDIRLP